MDAALKRLDASIGAVPLSTYRLQFNAGFGFEQARKIVDYLHDLGAGAIYASPYFHARRGSPHGYDVIDHNTLNPEIGSPQEHLRFIRAAQERGIGHIVDFVPNHMAIGGAANPWWTDVMQWGEASSYAAYFDIDWHPPRGDLEGKVLLPFLGDRYDNALARGEIAPFFDARLGTFGFAYFKELYPLAPHTYAPLLRRAAEIAETSIAKPLEVLAAAFATVEEGSGAPEAFARLCERVASLAASTAGRSTIEHALDDWRPRNGNGAARHRLDALLARQHYRLSFWRDSGSEINYRRFLDINDLAGLRIDDAEVLARTHQLLFEMLADGRVQGLRIDHVDGLLDPAGYCRFLRDRAARLGHPLYLIVEKILARSEQLRDNWVVDGTTGYDFLNVVNGLFVNRRAERAFDKIYRDFAAAAEPFDDVACQAKREVLSTQLAAELSMVAHSFHRISRVEHGTSGDTYDALREALVEVIASFPVYRTYVTSKSIGSEDRHFIERAVTIARKNSMAIDESTFDVIEGVLTGTIAGGTQSRYDHTEVLRAAMKFQQLTAAVMAKAVEDTAFYRYVRLLSLNEVGGDPQRFGTTVAAFHRFNRNAAKKQSRSMLATATHDHKRGEDARMRINALSEMPGRWRDALHAFSNIVEETTFIGSSEIPSANDRYALYQTLLATWPAEWNDAPPADGLRGYLDRIEQWLRKAMREANIHTSWTTPRPEYEDGAVSYLRRLFARDALPAFMRAFAPLARDVAMVGMISSLAQTTLKLTSPGVPDVYQGCELWDLSLVDPDNRRPVDFELRARFLNDIQARLARGQRLELSQELLRSWPDGRVKLFVTCLLLQLRKRCAQTFSSHDYRRLECAGPHGDRIVAYARGEVIVAVPRLVCPIVRMREDGFPFMEFGAEYVSLHSASRNRFRNVLTGERIGAFESPRRRRLSVADLFASFPVAVLEPIE